MRRWTDEETGTKMVEPDCADEWLFDIWAIGVDYDGCHTVDELKKLVDELVEMSKKARECLWENKLFGVHGEPEATPVPVVRCKDCKWFAECVGKDSGKPCGYGQCNRPLCMRSLIGTDDYCSYGERKEAEGNG